MPVNAKTASGGGDFVRQEAMDAGTYPCRVVQAIFFGLQEQRPFKGTPKDPRDEVGYTYEFLDEFCLDDDGEEDKERPRWLSERFPVHNIEVDNATSSKRIKVLDPEDNLDGDFLAVIGTPCMVTITKTVNKKDQEVNYVATISAMREKDAKKAAVLVNEATVFDVDEPNQEVFDSFPDWIKEKLRTNLGYKGSALEEMLEGGGTSDHATEDDDDEDEPVKKKGKKKGKKDDKTEW